MKKFGRAGSTLATVVIAAVVLAIVGASGAVAGGLITSLKIKNNTIKSIDVRDNALKSVDVTNGSLTGADVANGSLTQQDLTGGPAGVARAYMYSGTTSPTLDTPLVISGPYLFNSGGGTSTLTRTADGVYSVAFGGLDMNSGNVQVTAYGSATTWCKVSSWGGSTATIRCFNGAGDPTDSRFTVAFIR
jgi:hypothetical protein